MEVTSQRGLEKKWWRTIDKPLLILYVILVVMGWFNIYSAVFDPDMADTFSFTSRYGKQLLFIGLAFTIAIVIMVIDVRIIIQYTYFFYGITVALLVLVLVVGTEVSGAKAWIQIGGLSIQPAEFAKFTTALAFAKYVSSPDINMRRMFSQMKSAVWFILPVILILLQPDAGSALVYAAFLLVLYREGMTGKILAAGAFLIFLFVISLLVHQYWIISGLVAIALVVFFYGEKTFGRIVLILSALLVCSAFVFGVDYAFDRLSAHQKSRINVLLGKDADIKGTGYNVNQSKIAIGSGELFGKGYLDGTQTKFNFVPEQSTDFIFCTIGEEWGWVGTTIVLSLFLTLLLRIIMLAERQRNNFFRIYGYCTASIIFIHIFVNIGMTIGFIPVIGIPLPFFSYGGSSLWGFTLLLFVFVKMDMKRYVM
ncbi:MAG: rod shape-determining protein RodA [Bacteroidales bacterium]|jgi:rod shape determining protein RodA|nr:rod shape-determining protein RodA [Bacteroidales bacterium]